MPEAEGIGVPVLDTSFIIALEGGDAAARARLVELRDHLLVVPPWVVVEYLTGHTGRPERVVEDLDRAFTLVDADRRWAIAASRFRKGLRARGARFRLPDFWIATFARMLDTPVVTQDVRHFAALGVETLSW